MDEKKAIEETDLTIQRVNEGSKIFRDQVDIGLTSAVQERQDLVDLALKAREEWTSSDRRTKTILKELRGKIANPQVKHKLEKAKRYLVGTKKLLSPCLIPEYSMSWDMTDGDAEAFADQFAAEGWGNFMRLFVGNWEPYLKLYKPYMKFRKFVLTKINQQFIDCFFRRGGYLAERYIMPKIVLLDGCSNKDKPGFWRTNWMNGKNNINGTSESDDSPTHWYEYNGLPPHSRPEKELSGMRETGEFYMEFFGILLKLAKAEWGDFFLVEIGNEIDAKNQYHVMLREFINEIVGQNMKDRVFTSMTHDHFYESKEVNRSCIPIIHKVGDFQEYKKRKGIVKGMRHGASQDGREPQWTVKETKENVLKILQSDSLSYEGNLPWKDDGRQRLENLPYDLLGAYGQAFDEFLGG